ncbi:glycosyltransferase family 2 protein [Xylona heveae TC161]|uniref:Glycosyltransferase family 2 protein n=1 Tax=Xylona heveae (strain CBS 132557 / TC161) TaxID=1328760 RepID=A0A165I7D2_XYLHT|nr:glycosyltransferase family 2 protein [Xylona heveae TC161]KZF24490.1 glycosyltransferase family 2 protein [Xylona heveae TC161]
MHEFTRTILNCIKSSPLEIIVVTVLDCIDHVEELVHSIDPSIRVITAGQRNKRLQLRQAIPMIRSRITILADDDVIWPDSLMAHVLAPFEDPKVGAVGTSQRIRKARHLSFVGRIWEYLGACYIERRNFENTATMHMDGGISCLSGRTVVIRTPIIQSAEFLHGYCNETWNGNLLNADDDNYVTRFLVSHNWKICFQSSVEIETTLETNSKFLSQCLRWCRSNWRSNYKSIVLERHIWKKQPWSTYAVQVTTASCSLVHDPALIYSLYRASENVSPLNRVRLMTSFLVWLVSCKAVKLVPHFARYPFDLVYFPITILFGYFHGLIKYYALFTLSTSWGSRNDVNHSSVALSEHETDVLDSEKTPLTSSG